VNRPLTIGLTGNIATGKSTVLAYLQQRGAAVIDADKLAHQAMMPGGSAYAAVVTTFGPTIVAADGVIDRQALGAIVFADAQNWLNWRLSSTPPSSSWRNKRWPQQRRPLW
jgi:dephospho-CoA kinase